MGRKIKSKRHRGVKDPLEQATRRQESIAHKINCPPLSEDMQEVPKSVLYIKKFMDLQKNRIKKKNKNTNSSTSSDSMKSAHLNNSRSLSFPKRKEETQSDYQNRVKVSIDEYLELAKIEAKNNVKFKVDPITHRTMGMDKKYKNIVDKLAIADKSKKRKLSMKERHAAKRAARIKAKSLKRLENDEDGVKREKIEFGEIVHEPPRINHKIKSKIPMNSPTTKPGQKNLLLKSKLQDGSAQEKSKLLVHQKFLEEERKRVVEMYKVMKRKLRMQQ